MSLRTVLLTSVGCVVFCCLVVGSGCSSKIKAHGAVKFSDGTPLTKGTVFFSDGLRMFQGEIRANGTFAIGEIRDGDGIPPGNYKVWVVANTHDYIRDPETEQITNRMTHEIVIDPKYESRETSGLSYDIKPGQSSLEIVVEKP